MIRLCETALALFIMGSSLSQPSSNPPSNVEEADSSSVDRVTKPVETDLEASEADANKVIEPEVSIPNIAEPMERQTSLLKLTIRHAFWMESRRLMGERAKDGTHAQLTMSVQVYNNRSRRPARVKTAYLINDEGKRFEDLAWQDELGLGKRISDIEVESLKVTFLNPIFVVPKEGNYTLLLEHDNGEKAEFKLRPRSWEEHLDHIVSPTRRVPPSDQK
jgi:hypothetical protein